MNIKQTAGSIVERVALSGPTPEVIEMTVRILSSLRDEVRSETIEECADFLRYRSLIVYDERVGDELAQALKSPAQPTERT